MTSESGAAAALDQLSALTFECPNFFRTAWASLAPNGREFGSSDYERLEQEDFERMVSTLARLVSIGSRATEEVPESSEFKEDTDNVKLVLSELGHDVDIDTAASVWKHYSYSLLADWLDGWGQFN